MCRSAPRPLFNALASGALGLCLAALTSVASAQAVPTEPAIKAAYLHRFLSYVEWPESALPTSASSFVIGVLGSEAVAAALPTIVAGRQYNGRPIVVRSLPSGSTAFDGLQVLYIGRAVAADKVIPHLAKRPVLVVTETPVDSIAMLNFVVVDGRVRFEASPAAAEQAGLKLSARLLAIAERVHMP